MGLLRSKKPSLVTSEEVVLLREKLLKLFSNKNIICNHTDFEIECKELFKNPNIAKVFGDSELISTAQLFFEHNLNISITSKAGFMHRNTLIYRLDKIKTLIGLDIRIFKDASALQNLIFIHNAECN